MNPAEWLIRTSRLRPEAPALLCGAETVADYREFARRSAALAAAMSKRHGIGRGDRVGVFMTNRVEYLEVLYAIWFVGAAAVPINAKLHPREAAYIVGNSGATLTFVSDDVGTALPALSPNGRFVSVDTAAYREMLKAEPLVAPAPMSAQDMVWLFYTSGTTGNPKGVMITSGNIQAMAFGYLADVDEVNARDAFLYAAPISHGAGLYNFMGVIAGSRHACPGSGGFDPAELLDIAGSLGSTSLFAAPTMVQRLVTEARKSGRDGDGIKTIVYGGGPMYEADIIEAVDVLGDRLVQIYGQGECPMAITVLPRAMVSDRRHPRWRERLRSVGYAQSCSRVRVVGAGGEALGPGEIGEIVVSGAAVMQGYWRNEEATAATIVDGWLRTGDMGLLDDDGFLTLHDRSKDLIITGGSNVYPREVEEVLKHHPSVAEVSVVGRPHPEWGEEVVACVVLNAGHVLDAAALDALCLEHIARFKRPKSYVVLAALPKNNYGKVLKRTLRENIAAGSVVAG